MYCLLSWGKSKIPHSGCFWITIQILLLKRLTTLSSQAEQNSINIYGQPVTVISNRVWKSHNHHGNVYHKIKYVFTNGEMIQWVNEQHFTVMQETYMNGVLDQQIMWFRITCKTIWQVVSAKFTRNFQKSRYWLYWGYERTNSTPTPSNSLSGKFNRKKRPHPLLIAVGIIALYIIIAIMGVILVPMFNKYAL